MRPLTLSGTISPILAGTVFATKQGVARLDLFLAMLVASLLIQASINMLNDYFDFLHGQDKEKWIQSSEKSNKSAPSHHILPTAAGIMLFLSVLLGIYLVLHSTLWTAVIGVVGILFGYFYSAGPRPLASLGLGEIIAAIFLGFVPTMLAYSIQGNSPDLQIVAVSIPFALLISSMVLSNNIRDIEKDRTFRRTSAIILGRCRAAQLLTLLLLLTYGSIIVLIIARIVPWTTGLSLFALPLAHRLRWSFRPHASRTEEMLGMKWAAWHHWVFGLLYTFGIWL